MEETEKKGPRNGNLVFAINGEKFGLTNIDPSTTLLEFLRSHTRFKSPKLGCGEGQAISLLSNCVVFASFINVAVCKFSFAYAARSS